MTGSPPHTRGRSQQKQLSDVEQRFTPAYAGKIYLRLIGWYINEVHPRIRGEDKSLR